MALVNYDMSDEELQDSSDGSDGEHVVTQTTKPSHESNVSTNKPNLFARLPAPKTLSSDSSVAMTSLNDIIAKSGSGRGSGVIKITVPSLKHYSEDNEDSDEDIKRSKRIKRSTTGTGLSALLPKPKNTVSITCKSLMPQSVVRSKPNIPPPKLSNKSLPKPLTTFTKSTNEDKDNSQQKMDYFFIDDKTDDKTDDKEVVNKEMPLSEPSLGPKPLSTELNVCIAPKIDSFEQNVNYEALNYNQNQSSFSNIPSTDDITYKKLIASKFGEESAQEINIIDVDVSKHLSESKDWLKTISEEKEETYNGVLPTSTARRKHQITFLAFQAKQREVELKNQWAANKLTKNQSRSKYGF